MAPYPATWPGRTSRIQDVLAALLTTSLLLLILGIVNTAQVATSDPYPGPMSKERKPTAAELFFYFCGLPLATSLAFGIEIVLFLSSLLHPVVCIVWSVVAFAAWLYVMTMWGVCEFSPDSGGESCPRFYAYREFPGGNWSEGVWIARLAFGGVETVLLVVYLGIAARAVDVERKRRGRERRRMELEMEAVGKE